MDERLRNLQSFFDSFQRSWKRQEPLSASLRERARAYIQLYSDMNLGLKHESQLAYLPEHLRCEILQIQHRYVQLEVVDGPSLSRVRLGVDILLRA